MKELKKGKSKIQTTNHFGIKLYNILLYLWDYLCEPSEHEIIVWPERWLPRPAMNTKEPNEKMRGNYYWETLFFP